MPPGSVPAGPRNRSASALTTKQPARHEPTTTETDGGPVTIDW
jgi:hypothetical protein